MNHMDLSMLSQKQYAFLTATAKHVGFGGARGGGKSWAVRTKAKILAVCHDGIKVLIVRRTFPELVNNHIRQLQQELSGLATYNKTEKVFSFPNGSLIQFGYCNADTDLLQYQGAEFDVIFLDEAITVALITGGLSLAGVVVTCMATWRKSETNMRVSQAVTDTKIDELTREVRAHNGFAQRLPVVEEQIKVINHRLADLEREVPYGE